MPILLRTAAENAYYMRLCLSLLQLSMLCVQLRLYLPALTFLEAALSLLRATWSPSRTWASGVRRVREWSFDAYSDAECWERMRFRKEDFPVLLREFGLENSGHADGLWRVRDKHGVVQCCFKPMELLVIFLARMASINTWSALQGWLGGKSVTAYKLAFAFVLDHIYGHFKHTVSDVNRWARDARRFSIAIQQAGVSRKLRMPHASILAYACYVPCAGAPASMCIGFIDGTFRSCARPSVGQEYVYSGYYKSHGLKFQSVIAPNGMIIDFYGPVPGRRSDSYMLDKSGFEVRMRRLNRSLGMRRGDYHVYGDPAYALSRYIMRGFKGVMNPRQAAFSRAMNALRVSVEWGFMLVVRDWRYIDCEKHLKIMLQPIGKLYWVAAILTNVKSCVMAENHDGYGNLIAQRFRCSPPSLHEYLHG